jgi:CBS domain containing-hemolysin-like protein
MLVPENIPIGSLLQEFRFNKQHFAFVQNEHGTVLGIVTMEDVLEELVGSIQDEFDLEDPKLIEHSDGKYLVNGEIQLEELNQILSLELVSEEADTLSGLIVERFGHKIVPGKKLTLDDSVQVELIETDGIRVLKALISVLPENTQDQ